MLPWAASTSRCSKARSAPAADAWRGAGSTGWIRKSRLDRGDGGKGVGVELPLRGGDIFGKLGRRRRANDGCAHEPAAGDVAQRQFDERDAALLGQRSVGIDRFAHHGFAGSQAKVVEQGKA